MRHGKIFLESSIFLLSWRRLCFRSCQHVCLSPGQLYDGLAGNLAGWLSSILRPLGRAFLCQALPKLVYEVVLGVFFHLTAARISQKRSRCNGQAVLGGTWPSTSAWQKAPFSPWIVMVLLWVVGTNCRALETAHFDKCFSFKISDTLIRRY